SLVPGRKTSGSTTLPPDNIPSPVPLAPPLPRRSVASIVLAVFHLPVAETVVPPPVLSTIACRYISRVPFTVASPPELTPGAYCDEKRVVTEKVPVHAPSAISPSEQSCVLALTACATEGAGLAGNHPSNTLQPITVMRGECMIGLPVLTGSFCHSPGFATGYPREGASH